MSDAEREHFASVRAAVARNLKAPASILAALAKDPDARVRRAVASNPLAHWEVLEELSHNPETQLEVAKNISAPITVLERLATIGIVEGERFVEIREAVAKNLRAPEDVQRTLARDPSARVRRAVATNRSPSPEAMETLSHDPETRVDVARNQSTSESALGRLAALGLEKEQE